MSAKKRGTDLSKPPALPTEKPGPTAESGPTKKSFSRNSLLGSDALKSSPLVKICGLGEVASARGVIDQRPDFIGFIFVKRSPRYVLPTGAVLQIPSGDCLRVGVFADEPLDSVQEIVISCSLGAVQLHGNESVEYIGALRTLLTNTIIIKAIPVFKSGSFLPCLYYAAAVDLFLFDTAKGDSGDYGGAGFAFDWCLLSEYTEKKPFLLGGGVGLDNIGSVPAHDQLLGFDFNSKLESSPGVKRVELVQDILAAVRKEKR